MFGGGGLKQAPCKGPWGPNRRRDGSGSGGGSSDSGSSVGGDGAGAGGDDGCGSGSEGEARRRGEAQGEARPSPCRPSLGGRQDRRARCLMFDRPGDEVYASPPLSWLDPDGLAGREPAWELAGGGEELHGGAGTRAAARPCIRRTELCSDADLGSAVGWAVARLHGAATQAATQASTQAATQASRARLRGAATAHSAATGASPKPFG
jgi:hypothetical protein